jgi:hypothetical protein
MVEAFVENGNWVENANLVGREKFDRLRGSARQLAITML